MTVPPGSPGDNEHLAALFDNISRMLRSKGGSVDWDSAQAAATRAIETDAATTDADRSAVDAAWDLANLWLDQATDMPAPGAACAAMNRRDWLSATFDKWQSVVEPVADGMAAAMTALLPEAPRDLPPELLDALPEHMRDQMAAVMQGADFSALSQSLGAIAKSMAATMYGVQFGQALAEMSGEVLSVCDVGIPLGAPAGVLLSTTREYAQALTIPVDEALLYVTLRESAHQRLFDHAPWLSAMMLGALADYARDVSIDTSRIEQALSRIDPANPDSLSELLGGQLFDATVSPSQRAALSRLELLLALVEGWVTCVVTIAVDRRLPAAAALEESMRRRRASGGPAEKLLGGLVGLESRPTLIREATALWQHLSESQGAQARDSIWEHPDLLPAADDLADPTTFDMPRQSDTPEGLS